MPQTPSVPPPSTPKLTTNPIVLYGDAPEIKAPFDGHVGHRLAQLVDVDHARFGDAFELHTLFDRRALGTVPMDVAQFVGRRLLPSIVGRYVLFYGRAVCMSFGLNPRKPLDWEAGVYDGKHAAFVFAVIPDLDPSNDPHWAPWWVENTPEAARFLQAVVHPKARAP